MSSIPFFQTSLDEKCMAAILPLTHNTHTHIHTPYPFTLPPSLYSSLVSPPAGLSPFQVEFFSAALPVLIERLNLLPAPCLEWRLLQWLGAGSEMVEPQLHR
jgi:hypothetical protein